MPSHPISACLDTVEDLGRERASQASDQPASTRPATTLATAPPRSPTPVWERNCLRNSVSSAYILFILSSPSRFPRQKRRTPYTLVRQMTEYFSSAERIRFPEGPRSFDMSRHDFSSNQSWF